jgi:hypothetical protein
VVAEYCGELVPVKRSARRTSNSLPLLLAVYHAGEDMPEGSVVAEYCGELVPVKECKAREAAFQAAGLFYIFCEEGDVALPPELLLSMQVGRVAGIACCVLPACIYTALFLQTRPCVVRRGAMRCRQHG